MGSGLTGEMFRAGCFFLRTRCVWCNPLRVLWMKAKSRHVFDGIRRQLPLKVLNSNHIRCQLRGEGEGKNLHRCPLRWQQR
jgi:hypothetical protein